MATLAEWSEGALPTRLGGTFTLGAYDSIWPLEWINCDHNGNGQASCRFDYGSNQATVSQRTYFRMPRHWPERSLQIFGVRGEDGGQFQAAFALGGESNGGQARLICDGTLVASSVPRTLLPSRWYRIEMVVDHPNQRVQARVSHLHTNVPVWESGWVGSTLGSGTTSRMTDVGAAQGSLLLGHVRIAHLLVTDDVTYLGRDSSDVYPWNPPLGDYEQVKFWDGGLHDPEMVGLWESGQLVPAISAVYSEAVEPPEPPPPDPGVVLETLNFEGQTAGQPLTLSGNWSEQGMSGGPVFTASAAAARHGSLGARITNSNGFRRLRYAEAITNQTRCYDFYVNVRSMSTNVWLAASDTTASDLRLNSDGTVRMRADNVAVDTSTVSLQTGQWYRFSHLLGPTGQILRVYQGTSTEPYFQLSGPLPTPERGAWNFGLTSASNGTTIDFDTIRIGDGWLNPVGG